MVLTVADSVICLVIEVIPNVTVGDSSIEWLSLYFSGAFLEEGDVDL